MKLRQHFIPFLSLTLLSPLAAVADRADDERACCEDCNAGYFQGFIDTNTRFRYLEFRDWDCCLIKGHSGITENGSLVDGHYKWQANGDCTATIIESTGIYASYYPVGTKVALADACNLTGSVVSNTQRNSNIIDQNCCNGGGNLIYGVLSGLVSP